jgi:hypothetical protein
MSFELQWSATSGLDSGLTPLVPWLDLVTEVTRWMFHTSVAKRVGRDPREEARALGPRDHLKAPRVPGGQTLRDLHGVPRVARASRVHDQTHVRRLATVTTVASLVTTLRSVGQSLRTPVNEEVHLPMARGKESTRSDSAKAEVAGFTS